MLPASRGRASGLRCADFGQPSSDDPEMADSCGRRLISVRTTEALAARRAAGVRLGRPRLCPDDVLMRVVSARLGGATLTEIAHKLNVDCVPTPAGGARWYPSHLSRLLRTQDARQLLAALSDGE
jgi:hypothetical protein